MDNGLVIFDLDGTLLDTLNDLHDSLNYALSAVSYPNRTIDETRRFIGNGIDMLIKRALPKDVSADVLEKTVRIFKEYYKENCMNKTKPYDGVTYMLNELKKKNLILSVLSNKADFAVKDLCGRFFKDTVSAAAGDTKGEPKKPSPFGIAKLSEMFNEKRERTVYVGDSEVDIQTANNALVNCISVGWGYRDIEFLKEYGAKVIAKTPVELISLISKALNI